MRPDCGWHKDTERKAPVYRYLVLFV